MSTPSPNSQGLWQIVAALGSAGAAKVADSRAFADFARKATLYVLLFVLFVAGLVTVLVDLFQMTRMDGTLSASILGTVGGVLIAASLAGGIALRASSRSREEPARSPLVDALTLFLLDLVEEKRAQMEKHRESPPPS